MFRYSLFLKQNTGRTMNESAVHLILFVVNLTSYSFASVFSQLVTHQNKLLKFVPGTIRRFWVYLPFRRTLFFSCSNAKEG